MSDPKVFLHKSKTIFITPKKQFNKKRSFQGKKIVSRFGNYFNMRNSAIINDNKIINYSETITKLLGQIKTKPKKTSSRNVSALRDSYNYSNSSEIDDEKESEDNKNKNSTSPKKNQKLNRIFTQDFRMKKSDNNKKESKIITKLEKSPTLTIKDFQTKKDTIILKFHRYFFQDGEIEKINTIIKYNINKIKILETKYEQKSNDDNLEKILENEIDMFNIKNQVINLMDKFDEAFTAEKRKILISAVKDLNNFSKKYKFIYVEQLTLDWLKYLEDKKNEKTSLKYFGYYNQIREIMDKMLKEIKKKVDLFIFYREKKKKNSKESDKSPKENGSKALDKRSSKNKQTINKEDLLKSKEIIPIKLDIDIQNRLSLDEVEEIIQNLEKGDFGNLENKNQNMINKKKILKSHFNNRNDNELEAFNYPFKEEHFCGIF